MNDTPTERKWFQKKRYLLPAAFLGLSFIFGGGDTTSPTTTQTAPTIAPITREIETTSQTAGVPAATREVQSTESSETETGGYVPPSERSPEQEPTTSYGDDELSNDDYYTNVDGDRIHSPAYSEDGDIPAGASAQCRDGTYSFSANRRGTCSHHGGVAQWL